MRRAALLAVAVGAAGCTVGQGTGSADGTLFDVGCNKDNALLSPVPYSLKPTFFAGEPIEDVCPPPGQCAGPRMNRLVIRMQHTGNRVEVNDTLYFDVLNSLKVAQCVAGVTTSTGAPAWDTRLVTGPDGSPVAGLPWCDRSAVGGADGGAADASADGGAAGSGGGVRINLSTQDFVQASLAPLFTCVEARSVAVSLPGSWIQFQDFGGAIANGVPTTATTISGDFKIDFGQRLRASFHLVLGDQAVAYAQKTHDQIPDPRIGGALDGSFDFDLERGRAAQPFP